MAQPPGAFLGVIRVIDTISQWCGSVFAWMVIPLMLGLSYEVIARYGFNRPTFWAYDTAYIVYGSRFMLGAGYTLLRKGHIRTDFFYAKWPARRQGLIDATAYLFLFFPGMIFFLFASWDNAYHSWTIRETSEATAWRPYIYPFKMVMPVSAVLLIVQGISEFLKSAYAAKTGRWL